MRIAIVAGSHRDKSESDRIANYVSNALKEENGVDCDKISLANNPLPLWDEGVWNSDPKWHELWSPISETLKASSALVLIAPEWAGMVPPALKNFLLLCNTDEVGHKPALIVTISSGIGGSYPVAELRTSSYKNNRILYLPEHMIIRNVTKLLHQGPVTDSHDTEVRNRLGYNLKLLVEYGRALEHVRSSGVINHIDYPYGL